MFVLFSYLKNLSFEIIGLRHDQVALFKTFRSTT